MIDRLRDLLAAVGAPASPLELAEVIWLAGYLPDHTPAEAAPAPEPAPDDDQVTAAETEPGDPVRETTLALWEALQAKRAASRRAERRHPLYLPSAEPAEGRNSGSVLVPTAPMLREPLAIQRSLRPLKRRVPARHDWVLDEDATAASIAEHVYELPWIPVLTPARERWLSLALVVDTGQAMDVWRPLAGELLASMLALGAFRSVRLWFMADVAGQLGVRTAPRGPAQPPAALAHPGGRQAVALLSDCSGPHWWEGRMAPVVHHWATRGPTVILQPLAERLWRRTAALTVPGQATLPRPGAPNTEIRFTPHGAARARAGGVPVPVVELSADWARLVTTSGGPRDTAVAYLAAGSRPRPDAPVAAERDLPVPDRVRRFIAAASPSAAELAGHVAVTVPALPVMRLIQQRILPGSRPADLAEVLLSGLLTPVAAVPGLYDFLPGARAGLLELLPRQESLATADTLERISVEIQERAGTMARTFRAVMPVAEGTGTSAAGADQRPFALVSTEAVSILSRHAVPAPGSSPAEELLPGTEGTASGLGQETTVAATERPAPPPLLVLSVRTRHELASGGVYTIGRNEQADIPLTDPRVSWEHAVIRAEGPVWILEDQRSFNGTFSAAVRISRLEITDGCVVHFGDPEDGPVLRFELTWPRPLPDPVPDQGFEPETAHTNITVTPGMLRDAVSRGRIQARVMRIGRGSDNDIVLADLNVSEQHAELRVSETGLVQVTDLGSANGTFVNGTRVSQADLSDEDIITIGHATFRLIGGELIEYVDDGRATFEAHELQYSVSYGGRQRVLLHGISFPLAERSMMAVIGPAGAGRSTLFRVLTGKRPATSGSVTYDFRDLHDNYDELRHRIGLVPAESTLSARQTVFKALSRAAKANFPSDTTEEERNARIREVLDELSISSYRDVRIDRLSWGMRKRVEIALAVLPRPSLLFLDEPTAPLDPHLKRNIFEYLRGVADSNAARGATVVVVTTDVDMKLLGLCDRVLTLAPGGRMAYYGPPAEGLRYFGREDWADVFQVFADMPDRDFAAQYRATPDFVKYVSTPISVRGQLTRQEIDDAPSPPESGGFWQVLSRRRRS